jgi:hypothetical protein
MTKAKIVRRWWTVSWRCGSGHWITDFIEYDKKAIAIEKMKKDAKIWRHKQRLIEHTETRRIVK